MKGTARANSAVFVAAQWQAAATYLIMHRSRRSQRISASAEQSLQYTYGRVMAHASGVYDTLSNCGQPNPVVADITRRRSDSKNGLRMIGNP